MKLQKISILDITAIALSLLSFSTLHADTFHLVDGSVVEGSVKSENEESYILRSEISRNVYDEKIISKATVARRVKADPSIKAYKKLGNILPMADLTPLKEYDNIIANRIQPFIDLYPESENIDKVKEILKTLEEEKAVILSGGVKLYGKTYTKEQVIADRYEFYAEIDLRKLIAFAQKAQYRSVLDKLEEMEMLYPNSSQTRKAERIALAVLPHYEEQLKTLLANVDVITKKRDNTLESMSQADRLRTTRIFALQDKKYETRLAEIKQEKASSKWMPINPFYPEPIEMNLKLIPLEITRLEKANTQLTTNAAVLYKTTLAAINSNEVENAIKLFEQFKAENPSETFAKSLGIKINEVKQAMDEQEKLRLEEERLALEKKLEEERLEKERLMALEKKKLDTPDKHRENVIDKIKRNQRLQRSLEQ